MRAAACGFAVVSLLLSGCTSRTADPVQLVLISPHRDEIREEVALGFQDWFAHRSRTHHAAAQSLLRAWLDKPDKERHAMAVRACRRLFHDWSSTDLGHLPQLLARWEKDPNAESARDLLTAPAEITLWEMVSDPA